MKVAISAAGPTLESVVDPRFGRCSCVVFVETDDMSFEAIDNTNSTLAGGAGIQSARLVAQNGAVAVLTGNCGPNAHQTLTAAGIDVIVGCTGTIAETVQRFKAGELKAVSAPNVSSHAGMGEER